MNYMFLDKYDIRNYLDKEVGIDISDEIFDVITKEEEEYKKEKKNDPCAAGGYLGEVYSATFLCI